MKQAILHNWSFMRFIRLGMGVAILIQAVMAKDVLFSIAGLAFTGMAVFNVGCCGSGGCYAPIKKTDEAKNDIIYEEVV